MAPRLTVVTEPVIERVPGPTGPRPAVRVLEAVDGPGGLAGLGPAQLRTLAAEIRAFLVANVTRTGGHLGPNLGVVELTIALHRVFDSPRDRFAMDVSHLVYVHKMFTGRLDRFHTMRQFGGLNGFLLSTETEHDCFGAGHAGPGAI